MLNYAELFTYNKEANESFLNILTTHNGLSPETHDLMSHILLAHKIWLLRINNLQKIPVPGAWDRLEARKYHLMNEENYLKTTNYLNASAFGLNPGKLITYTNSRGDHFQNSIEEIFFHILNHSNYHRAQLAARFRRENLTPPSTDYIFYSRNKRKMKI